MSSQIQNLKSPTTKKKIKNFAILFFSLVLTLAVLSQISAANLKPTSDVGLNKADWLYYKSSNDLSAYLGKKSSTLPTVRYQKDNDYLEFSMSKALETDISSTTAVSLETNTKTPNTPTLFYRNILDGVDANYQITNLPFKVKEEIVLRSIKSIKSKVKSQNTNLLPTTFLFSAETTGKPVKQKDGSIAFFGDNGEYLFQLDKPFMIDGKGNRSEEVGIEITPIKTKTADKSAVFGDSNLEQKSGLPSINNQYKGIKSFVNSLYNKTELFYHKENLNPVNKYTITLSADSEWLKTATYPVIIDPTVTHNADSNFTGQMNRIADSDTTSSTQLESSYPEATKDPYTVMLLHFNEANGTTAGIRDYANTARVITANGNASTTSYVTQLGLGNSAAFDGTGDYLSLADSDDYTWAGDFSVDMWVRFNNIATYQILIAHADDTLSNFFRITWETSPSQWSVTLGEAGYPIVGSLSTNTWYHIAVARSGGVVKFFRDGKQVGSNVTNSTTFNASTNGINIGANWSEADILNGYLDEVRIIKGRALTPEEIKAAASRRPYSVYTSPVIDATASVAWNTLNWTEGGVNTGNGEQPYSTNSLVAQWDFNDTSGTTLTASSSGSCTTACNGTLNGFAYTSSQDQATTTTGWTANNKKWGAGALMFDGSNDYVEVADNAGWDFSSSDGSIEFWIYPNSTSVEQLLVGQSNSSSDGNWFIYIRSGGELAVGLGGINEIASSGYALTTEKWYHIAVVKNGSITTIYKNGISIASNSTGVWNNATTFLRIGGGSATYNRFSGVVDSVRIYKGRALSASEILSNYNAGNIEIQTRTGATSDPNDGTWEAWKPTTSETQLLSMDSDKGNWNAPEQIDGYTKLLLHMDGTDAATTFPNSATTTHTVTANGNAQVDTAFSKFSGASGLFDGTGDYLSAPDSDDFEFGSGDFTVDFWARPNVLNGGHTITKSDTAGYGPFMLLAGATDWLFYSSSNGSSWDIAGGNAVGASILNQWQHVAVARTGNNIKFYINGQYQTQIITSASLVNNAEALNIGRTNYTGGAYYYTGWVDELRISKGIARWTSNFTPPPRPYGSNVRMDNEGTLKMEGASSTKLTLGAPQIDGNTVALWHFEETGTTTGTFLYDSTSNANNATTTGTTVVDGIFGKARKFNGTSDVVNAVALTGGTAVQSVDFWVYPLTTTEYFVDLNGSAYVWANAGTITATGFTSPTIYVNGAVSSIIVAGQWQHITVTTGTGINVSAPKVGKTTTNFLEGNIDEVRILSRALSADEIAEIYRMGANHHLTRQVSAVDLSAQTKLAFWIAADRPGTGLEAMIGESDYANYELASSTLALSTTTVLYIKGDEIASSTSIKDSSFSGKAITANGNARTAGNGKIGNSVYFDGTGDYLSLADDASLDFAAADNFTIDFWMKHSAIATNPDYAITKADATTGGYKIYMDASGDMCFDIDDDATWTPDDSACTSAIDYDNDAWHHVAGVKTGTTKIELFMDGVLVASDSALAASGTLANTNGFYVGMDRDGSSNGWDGYIDSFRIIKGTALTADQIRQAYEYGLRTHPITIDFGATLQSSDLISSATDYNFSLTATTSGLSATTSGLYLGDKIIIKENLGGTEYTAQGTVNAINTTTGAITVPSWDTGSTFPASNGYSPNATVFKWQREYFDITGSLSTHRDAITNLTLRPTNGAEGRTIYLDDFRYNTNYLTASSSSAITSGNNRYLQYRAIFTSTDTFVSPFLTAFNTLYTSLTTMFPSLIGVSGGGFLSF